MFWLRNLKTLTEIISNLSVISVAFITGLWVYSKFIAERGLIPSVEFDITLNNKGFQNDKHLLEIFLHLKNLGSSTLIVHNLRIDLLYLNQGDSALICRDKNLKGRLCFLNSLKEDLLFDRNVSPAKKSKDESKRSQFSERRKVARRLILSKKIKKLLQRCLFYHIPSKKSKKVDRGIKVIDHNTFVQPQIEQIYTFGTVVPKSATYILVWSSFEYKIHPSRLQLVILCFSRFLGLTQFNLAHITEAHTCERIFNLQESNVKSPC